jgi:hypothetical protein
MLPEVCLGHNALAEIVRIETTYAAHCERAELLLTDLGRLMAGGDILSRHDARRADAIAAALQALAIKVSALFDEWTSLACSGRRAKA